MSRAARNGRREHCGQHGHVGGRREQNNEVGDHGIHRLSGANRWHPVSVVPVRATTMGANSDRGSEMGQEREAFAVELRRLRASTGLSLGELARAAHVNRGYVGHIEHGQRWPSRAVAAALDGAVGADGALLGVWTAGDAAARRDQVGSVVAASRRQQLQDSEVALMSAADESAHFLAWAEASNTGDLTVEEMHSDIRRIAHSYLKVPTLPLFARARAIRDHAFTLLAGGRLVL